MFVKIITLIQGKVKAKSRCSRGEESVIYGTFHPFLKGPKLLLCMEVMRTVFGNGQRAAKRFENFSFSLWSADTKLENMPIFAYNL